MLIVSEYIEVLVCSYRMADVFAKRSSLNNTFRSSGWR
jgi:hypothetical protein